MLHAPKTYNDVLSHLGRENVGLTFFAGPPFFVSYRELGALVRGNALHFSAIGIEPGAEVAVVLETSLEHVVVFLSLIALGAIPVSINPTGGSAEEHAQFVDKLVRDRRVRWVHHDLPHAGAERDALRDTRRGNALRDTRRGTRSFAWNPAARSDDRSAIAEVDPDDVAFVHAACGSLGDPSAVPVRHRDLIANINAMLGVDRRDPDTIGYTFVPLSDGLGLVAGVLSHLVYENPLYLSPEEAFFKRPDDFFSRVEGSAKVMCPMPELALCHLVRYIEARKTGVARRMLACLETVYCGGEAISRSTIDALLAIAPRVSFDPRALVYSDGNGKDEATERTTPHRFEPAKRLGRRRPLRSATSPDRRSA